MPFKGCKIIGGSSELHKVFHMDVCPRVCATPRNTGPHCFLRALHVTEAAELTVAKTGSGRLF